MHRTSDLGKAIVELLKHFGWTWIGIFTSHKEDSKKAAENLKEEVLKSGICVEFIVQRRFPETKVYPELQGSTANIIVIFSSSEEIAQVLIYFSRIYPFKKKVVIITADTYATHNDEEWEILSQLNGTMMFSPKISYQPELEKFLRTANPSNYPKNRLFENILMRTSPQFLRHFLAFDFAIEEINQNSEILPNITLGYDIYDACDSANEAVRSTVKVLSGGLKNYINYCCKKGKRVVAFIGHPLPLVSESIANILSLYGYPQINYGAIDPILSNKQLFPFVYHIVHTTDNLSKAIVELLKYFDWTWIGIFTSQEEDSKKAAENLKEETLKSGICVEFIVHFTPERSYDELKVSTANVIAVYGSPEMITQMLIFFSKIYPLKNKVVIVTADIYTTNDDEEWKYLSKINGTMMFFSKRSFEPKLQNFLHTANPNKYPNNKLFENFFLYYFRCIPSVTDNASRYKCRKNVSIDSISPLEHDIENLRITYNVYTAVYLVAHALHNMHTAYNNQLNLSSPGNKKAYAIQTPESKCSENCPPGYRKSNLKRHTCCYVCARCSAGEISNETDMNSCIKCQDDEWPDEKNFVCLKKIIEVLSFQDPLGSTLTSASVLLCVLSAIILSIFLKYRETPIVKANNVYLSYIILISVMFSSLGSLFFIGVPVEITCLMQNFTFNTMFAVAVTSVLAKTITVLIAFNITKPRCFLQSLLGRKLTSGVMLCGVIGECVICLCWSTLHPPFPDRDSNTKPGILILQCNVGSQAMFYAALGYNSFLAFLCFIVAFMAKKLPDRFNEARHISFSMLVFCIVWLTFIPAHISTKGKYMIAMRVFAILTSSTGILACIFFPKCYIILMRHDLNVRLSFHIK
uniref:G-protein coupled receptors family 3 profile domain-containing protein n=1 Tax=Pyxicephalus adspersus TaxID=30357 RepID=A0AAV3A1C4_PYXAD|nr:TPA: hypothetical protein GDO54_016410 [Pyxicephalus adspersus]